jgi:hypothetical protein
MSATATSKAELLDRDVRYLSGKKLKKGGSSRIQKRQLGGQLVCKKDLGEGVWEKLQSEYFGSVNNKLLSIREVSDCRNYKTEKEDFHRNNNQIILIKCYLVVTKCV